MALGLGIDPGNPATNAVIVDGKAHLYSDAAIAIASRLQGWRWAAAIRFVPKFLRDALYKLIARNRIAWFGRPQACDLPGPEVRARIIE
jgi:predicted DCC family thiol-disulfide oxidoreductase YuxK